MMPHQIARLVQDECGKASPDYGRIYSLIHELTDILGFDEAKHMLLQPQPPVHHIN